MLDKNLFYLFILIVLPGCGEQVTKIPPLRYTQITTIQMPAKACKIPAPRALTIGLNDELVVVDDTGGVIVFDKNGKIKKQWSMPASELGHPEGVWVLQNGKIAITDTHYARIVIFNPDGTVNKIFGKRGTNPGEFSNPVGIVEDDKGNIFVCEYGFRDRIQKFRSDGKYILGFGKSGTSQGEFQRPSGIAYFQGNLFIADAVNNRIQVFSDNGKHIKTITATPPFYLPYDIKVGFDNYLYVVEYGNESITKLTQEGELVGRSSFRNAGKINLKTPWGIAINSKGTIYIADTGNRRIVVLKNE